MRKTKKLLDEIIKEFEVMPIVSVVCKKVGISRNTFYKWKNENQEFSEMIDKAMQFGRSYVGDMAESQIVKKIQQGDNSMIKYWLNNNDIRYHSRTRSEERSRMMRFRGY